MIGGGCATERLPVERVTDRPPLGAAELNVTVPVALLPPLTLDGVMARDSSDGAVGAAARLMNADLVMPPAFASTSTVVKTLVALVVIGKLVELLPAGTLTVGGTCRSAGLLLVNVTTPPPAGADVTSWTMPCVEVPLTMSVGLTLNPASVGVAADPGRISSSLACVPAVKPRPAWTRTYDVAATDGAVIVKVALVLPAGTVTFGGTTTWPSMLPVRRIVAPPEGAGAVSVTVPVVVAPAVMLAAASVSDASAAGVAVPGGATVSHNDGERYDSAPYPESIRTRVAAATGEVATLKDAPVPPAG